MAKDPAVLFYTDDFLSGTFTMTNEQVGMYIRLLCLQHQKGRLREKDMLSICSAHDEEVFSKFAKDEAGMYYNQRMEYESERRKAFSESRRNNASRSKNNDSKPKKPKKAYAKHMGNGTGTINGNESKDEIVIILPFQTENFNQLWTLWKDYKKKEHKFNYKTPQSEQAALKQLSELSGNDERKATEIVHQSMANGWKGFFDLKDQPKGKQKITFTAEDFK